MASGINAICTKAAGENAENRVSTPHISGAILIQSAGLCGMLEKVKLGEGGEGSEAT
jgi:hypothetical protein